MIIDVKCTVNVRCLNHPQTTSQTPHYVSRSVTSNSFWPHGLQPSRLLCLWDSPGKNTGVGCHSLLQGIFPIQGLNRGLLHCWKIPYHLGYPGSPASLGLWKNCLPRNWSLMPKSWEPADRCPQERRIRRLYSGLMQVWKAGRWCKSEWPKDKLVNFGGKK